VIPVFELSDHQQAGAGTALVAVIATSAVAIVEPEPPESGPFPARGEKTDIRHCWNSAGAQRRLITLSEVDPLAGLD
jgi:hypothetical protein